MPDDLIQRWNDLSRQLGLRDAVPIGEELVARYGEPHRRYHDAAHLSQVLDLLDDLGADRRLHLSAWFHDAVYQPGRSDNERRSAKLARQRLLAAGLPDSECDFVARAVLATAGHADADPAFDALFDADLAVLGAVPDVYRHYRRAIREEFARVPELLFKPARARFLRAMLGRPSIYRTPACRDRFEAQARRNLQHELDQLEAGK